MNANLNRKLEEYRWLKAPYVDYPIVDCADFFDGNEVMSSFAANACEPGYNVDQFRSAFFSLVGRRDVHKVWISLYSFDRDELEWPYSDTAYVSTTLSPRFLRKHFGRGFPSDVTPIEVSPAFGEIPEGFVLYCLWWD